MVDQILDAIRNDDLPSARLPFLSYLIEDPEAIFRRRGRSGTSRENGRSRIRTSIFTVLRA